jgi:Fic-DOC domain mobile mystery protein B
MGLNLEYIKGQTPIDEEEKEALKILTISNRKELDEFEQNNIEKAIEWSLVRKYQYQDILSIDFIKLLHKKMFGDVWKWAGSFRKSNNNIGVDKSDIQAELKALNDDCTYWIENNVYEPDEIAVRYKHRMVSIHPFPNGNGRDSRLCADIIISHVFGKPVFTWGGTNLVDHNEARRKYLEAIYEADRGNIEPLIFFAKN